MMRRMMLVIALLAVGCGEDNTAEFTAKQVATPTTVASTTTVKPTTTARTTTTAAVTVKWANYAPGLQATIDGLAATKDCAALQREFNNADANSTAQRNRTGESNVKLMEYIDAKIRAAGCA